MWRALFFAVGVMLIVLGVECLVVDQYLVSQRTRIPTLIARMLDGDQPDGVFESSQYQAQNDSSSSNFWGGGGSRFQASPYSAPSQSSSFSLANFGGANSKKASNAGPLNPDGLRVVQTKDWMPWSLLAAGTLVVLYTNSTRRGYSGD